MPKVSDIYKRPPISDRDWTLPFGKFRGRSIAWLFDAEPDYVAWCLENEIFSLSPTLQEEFEQMNPWVTL